MKKIITLYDVLNAPWHVLSFAIKIAKENGLPITGYFLEARRAKSDLNYPFPSDMNLTKDKLSDELISHENALLIDDNIQLFRDECETAGIDCEISKNVSVKDVINQRTTGDLIIADTRADFLDEILPKVSCPVCLTSENELPKKLVLMLDEGASGRNAIENFATLFPHLTALPSSVVSINLSEEEQSANEIYVKHQLQNQFSSLNIISLHGTIERELLKFLNKEQEHTMVVMGAFGRSGVSRFFHDSLANVILHKTRLSLFIVHK
jgi:nucleotide-binding universal stress UspA family protein